MESHLRFQALKRRCELENEIRHAIHSDNGSDCSFVYSEDFDESSTVTEHYYLTVVTLNPKHREMFSLYNTKGHPSEVECLDEVIAYLKEIRKPDSNTLNYKVQWVKRGGDYEPQVSYFYVNDILDLAQKFYENKNPQDYVIQRIEMNPIS